MKKRTILFVLIFTVSIIASACSNTSTTQKYIDGVIKTSENNTIKSKTSIKINIKAENPKQENIEKLEAYKDIIINIDSSEDNKNKKAESTSYIGIGDIIITSKIYLDNENAYIKSSLMNDKYFVFDKNSNQQNEFGAISPKESEKLFNDLRSIWNDSIENEIISDEGTVVDNTPDGDIKVTKLTLSLDDSKAKNIIYKLATTLGRNDNLKKVFLDGMKKYSKNDEEIIKVSSFINNLPEEVTNLREKYSVENLKLTAKLDKDSFIIEENVDGIIKISGEEKVSITFSKETKRWNINKPLVVDIPKIDNTNSSKIQDFKFDESKIFESLKKKFSQ